MVQGTGAECEIQEEVIMHPMGDGCVFRFFLHEGFSKSNKIVVQLKLKLMKLENHFFFVVVWFDFQYLLLKLS